MIFYILMHGPGSQQIVKSWLSAGFDNKRFGGVSRSTYLSRRCQCAHVRVRVTFRFLTPFDACPQKTKPCVLILCVDFAVDGGNWIRFVDTFRLISD